MSASRDENIDEYKELLENLPGLDQFQLISHLFKFSIEFGEDEDTEKMRTLLKKAVVEELLKTIISDKDSYESLLIATRRQLHFGAMEKGYGCCCAGCPFIERNTTVM